MTAGPFFVGTNDDDQIKFWNTDDDDFTDEITDATLYEGQDDAEEGMGEVKRKYEPQVYCFVPVQELSNLQAEVGQLRERVKSYQPAVPAFPPVAHPIHQRVAEDTTHNDAR